MPNRQFFNKEIDLKVFKPFGCTSLFDSPLENTWNLYCIAERGIWLGVSKRLLCYKEHCAEKKSLFVPAMLLSVRNLTKSRL